MFTQSFRISFAGLIIFAVSAWAAQPVGPARLEGIVKDSKGQSVAGAEVHIKPNDGGQERIVRTDADGRYGISKLPVIDYEVILFVKGQVKANVRSQKVFPDKPTKLDFKLTGQFAANKPASKHTHMVYVPAETGSNLSGRWVEVDDNAGSAAATAGTGRVERMSAEAARRLQNGGTSGGGN